jgi:hypothetical protein
MVSLHSDFLTLSLDKRPMKHMGCIFYFLELWRLVAVSWIGSGYILLD